MKNTGLAAQDQRPGVSAGVTGAGVASDQEIAELEELLQKLLSEHEELLALAGTHRQAIQNADPATLGGCVQRQNEVVRRVAELESRRLALVVRLAEKMKPLQTNGRAQGPIPDRPTITTIAKSLAEPVRTRLVSLAERLRELLARLQREHAALREASAALAAHMEGLMRQMAKKLSHAGTYGRRGLVESRVQVVSALDLRS
jgi:hypothetical protein